MSVINKGMQEDNLGMRNLVYRTQGDSTHCFSTIYQLPYRSDSSNVRFRP
jgi:hypothetical protein